MSKQVVLEDDVIDELKNRAIKLDMVFSSINDVLRVILNVNKQMGAVNTNSNYPSSKVHKVQVLLDELKETIFHISKNGMRLYSNNRWVANPNTVTITVQDARAQNLRVTVYGKREEFMEMQPSIELQNDMSGYSRFVIDDQSQIQSAINIIRHSYKLKEQRGRL